MSVTLDRGGGHLKDSVCQVEAIIVDDVEDVEEDILFINVGYSSVSSQTDPQYFDACQVYIPGVPIFYCGQPSPGTATTQCLIPHLTDACVGTDTSRVCSPQQPTPSLPHNPPPPASSTGVHPKSSVDDAGVNTESVAMTRNGKYKCICSLVKLFRQIKLCLFD